LSQEERREPSEQLERILGPRPSEETYVRTDAASGGEATRGAISDETPEN